MDFADGNFSWEPPIQSAEENAQNPERSERYNHIRNTMSVKLNKQSDKFMFSFSKIFDSIHVDSVQQISQRVTALYKT
jgi:hypothetical protein